MGGGTGVMVPAQGYPDTTRGQIMASALETRLPQILVVEGSTAPTGNPAGEAWLYYDSSTNQLMLAVNGGSFSAIETLANVTLQSAYDSTGSGAGRTINLDGGAVTFNNAQAVATDTLDINVSAGSGIGLAVTMSGTSTGLAALFSGASISAPGAGSSSERFGASATAAGANSVSVDNGATE